MALNFPARPAEPDLNSPATYNQRVLAGFSWCFNTMPQYLEGLTAEDFFPVQSSAADTTAGKVLLANAYGWGGMALTVPNDNLDDIVAAGNYFLTTAVLSNSILPAGYAFVSGSCLLHIQFNAENSAQFLVAHGTGYAFTRIKDAGVWKPWAMLYSNTNLIGNVSQSAGVPTGAVIERGSNANGEYVRFADGTQICTHQMVFGAPNVVHGQIYTDAAATTWVYPASFINGATIGAHNVDVGSCFFSPYGVSNNSCSVRVLRALSSAATPTARLMALGRWF